jgi:hypothetical protein
MYFREYFIEKAMKKLLLLSFVLISLSFYSDAQISFDTTYHENLNVDSSQFEYRHFYKITNNATDPADTMFTWEVTHVDKEDSWDHMVLLPDYCGFINPTRPWNFKLGKDTSTFIVLSFYMFNASGSGIMTVKVYSILHPEIKDSITLKINARSLVSIEDSELKNIEVYPNPASDYITVEADLGDKYSLTNLQGQTVKEGLLENYANQIDASNLARGTYFLKVLNERSVGVRKVVVE